MTGPVRMHEDQLTVSARTVRSLVARQFPEWRELPVRAVRGPGTVNAIFRLGDRLAARFPLKPADVDETRRWLAAEAAAGRELLGRTRFRTSEPVALGEPGAGYPLPWSVQTWLPGVTATDDDPCASVPFALDLAAFVADVRAIDTRGRPFHGRGRGADLRAHDGWMETCLRTSEGFLDVARLRRTWETMRELPRTAPDVMTHGDLIPGNVLVAAPAGPAPTGAALRLAGVIDVGGLGPADPALDLLGAWHLLDAGPRAVFRAALSCDDLEWARGRAWAFEQSMGAAWYYRDTNPAMSRMGLRTIGRILADEPSG